MNPANPLQVRLSVVMPALNEARTIAACVHEAAGALGKMGLAGSSEIVVADNGSADGTADAARNAGARVVNVRDRGFGFALRGGLEAAQGEFIIMADADRSYDFSMIPVFYEALSQGLDLVVGNRYAGKIHAGAMPPLHRYAGTPFLTGLTNALFGTKLGDINCGMRGIRREAFERLELSAPGMEFTVELIARAALAGMTIGEVPCDIRRDGRDRGPHLRTWRDGFRYLACLLGTAARHAAAKRRGFANEPAF